MIFNKVFCRQKKPPGAAAGINNRLSGCRLDAFHDCFDQSPWSKILPGATFGIFGDLREQAFINIALDIFRHRGPLFFVNGIDYPFENCRFRDLVLGFGEDFPQDSRLFCKSIKNIFVMVRQFRPGFTGQRIPSAPGGNAVIPFERRPGVFIRHLQKDEVSQLFQIIAVGHPFIPKDASQRINFRNNIGIRHAFSPFF